MVNPELLEYVRQQTASGISRAELAKTLIATGWQVGDINDVFAVASSMPTTQLPVQAPTINSMQPTVSSGTSHAGMWAIIIIVILLMVAGGAFAAYQAGLFTLPPGVISQ